MKLKYDVGIVGCWYWGNYGSLLNGYSTFNIVKKIGLVPLNIVTPNNSFEPHAKRFLDLAYKDTDVSETLPFERVKEFNAICDIFLTGSDQIWNFNPNKKNYIYDYFFRLDFASEYKKKISFSTSLGKIREEYDDVFWNYKQLYDRYDSISLREHQGVEYFNRRYGINATELIEPVFVTDRAEWELMAERSDYNDDDYVFSYILDPTQSKRRLIKDVSSELGMKNIIVLDGFSSNYESNYKKMDLEGILPNVSAVDLLKCFINAKYVITDSFHGTCFAIIFNKPFISIGNEVRGNDRFISLLDKMNLTNRFIDENLIQISNLKNLLSKKVQYDKVNKIIENERTRSFEWLKNELSRPSALSRPVHNSKISINEVLTREKCVGCGACVAQCKAKAIELKPDEKGIYRGSVNRKWCVNCGQCVIVCPALHLPRNNNTDNPAAYAFINKDDYIHRESSSGGGFSAVAEVVLEKNGVVVGAKWNQDFTVSHAVIKNAEDLQSLRKSKYFQSYIGDVFIDVKNYLDSGKDVLFSGTPCQVWGLKKYLSKPYQNLILMDVLCANCPSQLLFEKYRKEKFGDNSLAKYDFRYKKDVLKVWNAYSSKATMKSGEELVLDKENDPYLRMYHTCSLGLSSQCRTCKYQGKKRVGDITIGDCWGIQNYDKTMNPKFGVSLLLINNDKGELIIKELMEKKKGILKEEPLEEVMKYNAIAFSKERNWKQSIRSKVFWDNLEKDGFSDAVNKAFNCKSACINSFKITAIDSNNISFTWSLDLNDYVSGYIIEKMIHGRWERVKKIENRNTLSTSLPCKDDLNGARYRIKTYYFDESVALYGDEKEVRFSCG